jgi:ribosomal protein S27AE
MNGLFKAGAFHANFSPNAMEPVPGVVADIRSRNEEMRLDVEKLFMITEALWLILKEKHGYTDEHLASMIQEIDLRDGKLDGKVRKQPNPICPQCGRTLMGKHSVCLYCGTAVVRDPFER